MIIRNFFANQLSFPVSLAVVMTAAATAIDPLLTVINVR
jgi:hypothetical protein